MNSYESTSMFGTLLGAGIGFVIPGGGLLSAVLGGSLLGGLFGSFGSKREQEEQKRKLAEQQAYQNKLLQQKLKADTAELYSSVSSAIGQTSGAMGAIY